MATAIGESGQQAAPFLRCSIEQRRHAAAADSERQSTPPV
jgi:hypothetical protein